jgi:hypothetical protein
MEFKIPRITRKIEFKEYDPEFGEMAFEVWVNPPRALFTEQSAIVDEMQKIGAEVDARVKKGDTREDPALKEKLEALNTAMEAWYGSVFTQNGEPLTAEDIHSLVIQCWDIDPRFWDWLRDKALSAILEHREEQKN